jgi:hypothetical protein
VRVAQQKGLRFVTNALMYSVSYAGLADATVGHDAVAASETSVDGLVLSGSSRLVGRSAPTMFYFAQLAFPVGGYSFGSGDPPANGSALTSVGGLGPMIINGLRYGSVNMYAAGVPAGAPSTGDPGATYGPYLIQRSNATYKAFNDRGASVGKVVFAWASAQKRFLAIMQPNGITGVTLDALRDKLLSVGIDNAVFGDGSDSVSFYQNGPNFQGGSFIVRAAEDKDETNTVGLGFQW